MRLVVACLPGLQGYVEAELRGLGYGVAASAQKALGVVDVEGGLRDVMRLNLELRCATRVLIELGSFEASSGAAFRRELEKLLVGSPRTAGEVKVTIQGPPSGAVSKTQAAKYAADAAKGESIGLRLRRGVGDVWTASIDTSGDPLHVRGYHGHRTRAPTKPSVAAAMLLDDDGAFVDNNNKVVLDPFCGSGTFAIEAALRRRNVAPGARRSFAFEETLVNAAEWEALRDARKFPTREDATVDAFGSDRDNGAVLAAKKNADLAGVGDFVRFDHASFSTAIADGPAPKDARIVTNLPWQGRLGGTDTRNLVAGLGAKLRRHRPDARLTFLVGHPKERPISNGRLVANLGFTATPRTPTLNLGGIPAMIYDARVPNSSASPTNPTKEKKKKKQTATSPPPIEKGGLSD